jgi:hypothetical protein
MSSSLNQLAQFIAASSLHDHIVNWLRTVPGLPPIVQSVHILGIGCVVASAVMLNLRILGWALPSQQLSEMSSRLRSWFWGAAIVLVLSGLVFLIARPRRYFANPIFGLKMGLLIPALVLSAFLLRVAARAEAIAFPIKLAALISTSVWITILAGRWIAYVDYLLPPE